MTDVNLSSKQHTLKWLYLAWLSIAFTIFVFVVLGTIVRDDPTPFIKSWGIFGDIATFAIGMWEIGMILAAGILLLLLKGRRLPLSAIGLGGKLNLISILFAVGGFIVTLGVYHLTEITLSTVSIDMFWRGSSNSGLLASRSTVDYLILFIGPVIISPITEEMVFRGYVLTALLERMGKLPAAILAALIFTSVHFMFGIGLMVYIFFVALITAFIYMKFKSLYPCMLMHFLINLWAYVIVPALFM